MSDSWYKHAECLGAPISVFFVTRGKNTNAAKKICAKCTVVEECLNFALSFPQDEDYCGVFGGKSPDERIQIRKRKELENTK